MVSAFSTPTVRRHSLTTDLDVIVAALDGGARTLPPAFAEAASRRQASKGEGIIREISNRLG